MRLVCEFPEFQSGAGREMGWRKGDLQKLTFLIGSIYWATRPQVVFFPVSPSKWKGQLPKSVVEHRVIESLGKETCARLKLRTHAWDAAGIGLWAIKQGVCDELL